MSVPSVIRIQMFGGFVLWFDGKPCNLHLCGPTRQLLAFLLYQANQKFRRERLSELLWPEKEPAKARSALNTALWRIRKAICDHHLERVELESEAEVVGLTLDPSIELDAHQLTSLVKSYELARFGDTPCVTQKDLTRVLANSKGLFLDGEHANWVLVERERLLNTYMRGQSLLLGNYARQGDYERALSCGRDILECDPLHEGIQRQVMWLYVLNGQRARAIQQYRSCASLLKRELDIAPMSETEALYQHILNDTCRSIEPDAAAPARKMTAFGDFNDRFALVSNERRAVLDSLFDT